METFRDRLKQEFLRRSSKNPSYSLRAFAQQLEINHATLSTILSGKRGLTTRTVLNLSKKISLSPEEVAEYLTESSSSKQNRPYHLLQNDIFSFMSEWYYDAILELSLIKNIKLSPESISQSLGISNLQARLALETLERLELLKREQNGKHTIQYQNSTNILDPDISNSAHRKNQESILEKSIEAISSIDRRHRDHTSMTMAINTKDIPEAKKLIKKFRQDLNSFLQRTETNLNEVYQLQISFFPLSKLSTKKESSI